MIGLLELEGDNAIGYSKLKLNYNPVLNLFLFRNDKKVYLGMEKNE